MATRTIRLGKSALIATLLSAASMSFAASGGLFGERLEGVELTGVHHMGLSFKVDKFYVNSTYGGNVGWEGGGGSITCCVELPSKWRPGLTVTVRWGISDWSQEVTAETDKGNYQSIRSGGRYRAEIPVEKYESAEHLFVHFFEGGKARVVSSSAGVGIYHPIPKNDPGAVELATQGTRVEQLFTEDELAEIRKKADERAARFGTWQ